MIDSDHTSLPLRAVVVGIAIAAASASSASCASSAGSSPAAVDRQSPAVALLEFRLIHSVPREDRIAAILDGAVVYLDPDPVITDADLTEVRPNVTADGLILSVDMTPTAAARVRQITGENIGRRMAVIFNSKVVLAPTIQSAVGGFTFVKVPVDDPDAAASLVRKRWPAPEGGRQ